MCLYLSIERLYINQFRDLTEWPLGGGFEGQGEIVGQRNLTNGSKCLRSPLIKWFSTFSLRGDLRCCECFTTIYEMFTTYANWTIQTFITVLKKNVNFDGTHS